MQKVIDTVAKVRTNGVVFLAWGSPAQKRMAGIPVDKHLVLKSVHPSPLSAARGFVSTVIHVRLAYVLTRSSSTVVTLPSATSGLSSAMGKTVVSTGISTRKRAFECDRIYRTRSHITGCTRVRG
jgi:hypothetical protein